MNENITFGFQTGRKDRIHEEPGTYAKEFFYSYHNFNNDYNNVNLIEFQKVNTIFYKIMKYIFYSIRYLTTIPFYCEEILSKENKQTIKKTNYLICVNQRVAFSLMPLTLMKSILGNINISVFIMGLFLDSKRNIVRKIARNLFLKLFCYLNNHLIFLSKNEMEYAKQLYPQFQEKFNYLPFSIDTKFWNPNVEEKKDKQVLFIGNDEKRDFDFVKKLPKEMQDCKFIFISKFINVEDFDALDNVTVINGKWAENTLSDLELKEIYNKSSISIIPLIDSYQPSGQSVALQSISMKVPTMITKTKGFWDYEMFSDSKNIFFVNENSLDLWKEKIYKVLNDPTTTNRVVKEAKSLVDEEYNLDVFYNKLKSLISN